MFISCIVMLQFACKCEWHAVDLLRLSVSLSDVLIAASEGIPICDSGA